MYDLSKLNNFIETKLTRTVGNKLLTFFIMNFSNEGYYADNTFVGWKDRKRDTGKPILYKTGAMKSGFVLSYDRDTIVIKNVIPYSKYHQEGTKTMPSRPMLYDGQKVNDTIETIVLEELDKYFKM